MQVQGQHVVLAAHVHAVMVLVFEQDPVVGCVEQEVEEVGGACGLKLCGRRAGQQLGSLETIQTCPLRQKGDLHHTIILSPQLPPPPHPLSGAYLAPPL